MKYIVTFLFLLCFLRGPAQDQLDQDIISLAQVYHIYHWRKESPEAFEQLNKIKSPELEAPRELVAEVIKTNNNVLSDKFLSKPSNQTLKMIYFMLQVNYNMFDQDPKDPKQLLTDLKSQTFDEKELLAYYYNVIFGSLVNKNRDKDYSNLNFVSANLSLTTETDRAILFLVAMERFGIGIWGYMNIAKKNCAKVLEEVKRWPKFDGVSFDSIGELTFEDFEIKVDKRKPKVSFKKYYEAKYMQALGYFRECSK